MLEANIFREKTAKDPLEVNERIKVYEAVNPYVYTNNASFNHF